MTTAIQQHVNCARSWHRYAQSVDKADWMHVNAINNRDMYMRRARELKRRAAALTPRELEMLAILERVNNYFTATAQGRSDLEFDVGAILRKIQK